MNQIVSPDSDLPPGVELGINPDKVCHIIAKARQFDAKEGLSDPDSGSNASDDGMTDVLEDLPTAQDATRLEIVEFIPALNEDDKFILIVLAWVGGGPSVLTDGNELRRVAVLRT